jgi:hypothetical protein
MKKNKVDKNQRDLPLKRYHRNKEETETSSRIFFLPFYKYVVRDIKKGNL